MKDVFLCYRAKGAQTAKLFKRYMAEKGFDSVWYSDDESYGNYRSDIPRIVSHAQCAVLFISDDFTDGFSSVWEASGADEAECITAKEIVEIERRLQEDPSFRIITVYVDRGQWTLDEQAVLRKLFEYDGVGNPDSVAHFAHSNIVKFDTRRGYEEVLFEQLSGSIFPSAYFKERIVGNFKFLGRETTIDVIEQDIKKPISVHLSAYSKDLPFHSKIERMESDVFVERQNDTMISVVEFDSYRESNTEHMQIYIKYKPIQYRLFHKTLQLWDNELLKIHEKLYRFDCENDEPYIIPNAMGLALMVVTSDGYLVFSKRSSKRRIRSGEYDCSIVEGLKIEVDDVHNGQYDTNDADYLLYECFRAYREEISSETDGVDICINGLILDKKCGQWNLIGTVFTKATKEELTDQHLYREDTYEKNQLIFVPLKKEEIVHALSEFLRVGLWDTACAVLQFTLLRLGMDMEPSDTNKFDNM